MAQRTTPTPCSTRETAGGPRRGPPSETSLGGNCRRSRPICQGRARGNRARRRRAKTHSFVGQRDTHTVVARSEDNQTWNPPHLRADRPTKGWQKLTPRTGRKNAPKRPTAGIPSLEIRSLDPEPKRVTPSWRNTDQITKEDFVAIEWEENHTWPVGWPHREVTKDRWREEAFVPIECAEIHHTTQYGWPHREGSAPTPMEGVQRVFGPIENWDKLDPSGRPQREDSNQTPGRWRKSRRSDRGPRQTRPGRGATSQRLEETTK